MNPNTLEAVSSEPAAIDLCGMPYTVRYAETVHTPDGKPSNALVDHDARELVIGAWLSDAERAKWLEAATEAARRSVLAERAKREAEDDDDDDWESEGEEWKGLPA